MAPVSANCISWYLQNKSAEYFQFSMSDLDETTNIIPLIYLAVSSIYRQSSLTYHLSQFF
jgi:hypothetical protein